MFKIFRVIFDVFLLPKPHKPPHVGFRVDRGGLDRSSIVANAAHRHGANEVIHQLRGGREKAGDGVGGVIEFVSVFVKLILIAKAKIL